MRAELRSLTTLHQQGFPPVSRPIAAAYQIDESAIHRYYRDAETADVPRFRNRQLRAEVEETARQHAEAEIARQRAWSTANAQELQAQYDAWWAALCENNSDVVFEMLSRALSDNSAPSAPIGIDGDRAVVVIVLPDVGAIPERKPAITAAGNPTTKQFTKTERNAAHLEHVASHLLVTAREVWAVAPGINRVTTVGVRPSSSVGNHWDAIVTATFHRQTFEHVNWTQFDSVTLLRSASDVELNLKGRTREVSPIQAAAGSDLASLIQQLNASTTDQTERESSSGHTELEAYFKDLEDAVKAYATTVRRIDADIRARVNVTGTFTPEATEVALAADLIFLVGGIVFDDQVLTDGELHLLASAAKAADIDTPISLDSRSIAETILRDQQATFASALTEPPELQKALRQVDERLSSNYAELYRDARLALAGVAASCDGPLTTRERVILEDLARAMASPVAI